jgi:hypothetical protein
MLSMNCIFCSAVTTGWGSDAIDQLHWCELIRLPGGAANRPRLRATDGNANDKGPRKGVAVSGKNSRGAAIPSKRSYPALPRMVA